MENHQFRSILVNQCGLDPEKPLIAGVSGGPDSLYLLHLLKTNGMKVIAAHLDHSLRPSSISEAEFVAGTCLQWGIPYITNKIEVAPFSREQGLSIEEAARILRYQFLFDEAKRNDAQAVLVAHHADDQVETILMHLLRGSGMGGLAGMRMVLLPNPWSSSTPLVRPLLTTRREEIDEYCRLNDLHPIIDKSNEDVKYFRNKIRHDLLPFLETYNPLLRTRLLKMAEVLSSEDDLLIQEVESIWQRIVKHQSGQFIILDRKQVSILHTALLRRVIRKAIYSINRTLRDIDFDAVERALQFCRLTTNTNHLDLPAGLEMFVYLRKWNVIAEKDSDLPELWPQMAVDKQILVTIPGKLVINDHWVLNAQYCEKMLQEDDPFTCYLDANEVEDNLIIRTFINGDRFLPYGMLGKPIKLGDFWTNEGLPARGRGKWPLLCCGNQIAWVPGFRIAHPLRITEHTRKCIRFSLEKK